MANIIFTIPSVLNAGGGEKKTEISADSLQDAFAKISEILGDDFIDPHGSIIPESEY